LTVTHSVIISPQATHIRANHRWT